MLIRAGSTPVTDTTVDAIAARSIDVVLEAVKVRVWYPAREWSLMAR